MEHAHRYAATTRASGKSDHQAHRLALVRSARPLATWQRPRPVAENCGGEAPWPRRIGLGPRDPRDGRLRGGACGQMEKSTAGKFHFEPPSLKCGRRDVLFRLDVRRLDDRPPLLDLSPLLGCE